MARKKPTAEVPGPSCATCAFWFRSSGQTVMEETDGECRFNPPACAITEGGVISFHPISEADHVCGNWSARLNS